MFLRGKIHGSDILLFFAYTGGVFNAASSGLPNAWVVKCKKCSCTITCRAVDPQIEHAEPDKSEPAPQHPVIVSCSCCWTAFRYSAAEVFKGQPSPSNTCSVHRREEATINNPEEKRSNAAILIAASLIAAVRLNKEEIRPSPSVAAKIADSIRLAEMIQARLRH
ncbi:MAG: hypothetical protein HY010_12080 [Acidobacteria bacterium]|nr:hypothetical protein [Acidobacteriota bacterium]